MAPSVFEIQQFEYLQNHLRILSAFYGILKPMDGVTPYRLEMQAKVGIGDAKNLLKFCSAILSLHFQIAFSSSFDLLFIQFNTSAVLSI